MLVHYGTDISGTIQSRQSMQFMHRASYELIAYTEVPLTLNWSITNALIAKLCNHMHTVHTCMSNMYIHNITHYTHTYCIQHACTHMTCINMFTYTTQTDICSHNGLLPLSSVHVSDNW